MKLYVAVTDGDWFRHLRGLPNLDEANFWQPGGSREFRALAPGEPFLFKLHSPQNFIVGGGFFAHGSILPCSLAWEAFGQKNGAGTFDEMRRRIERYRRVPPNPQEDYKIGCLILTSPFFLDEADWIPVPADFSRNIVSGKTYDSDEEIGRELWARVALRLKGTMVVERDERPMFGEPILIKPRLGQGAFRVLVTDTYSRRCAVTGEKALPVLEAAHIRSVASGGRHEVSNGLLLRSDIHRLFDRGYVTVTPDLRFRVSRRLRDEFENGEPYYPFEGREISLPTKQEERPHRDFLEWHAETVFKG